MNDRLTNQQIQQQEAAAFGLPLRGQSIDVSGMTHEQIEALRGVLFQHDAQNAAMQREFDLNKPPTPPYRYQEYPRMLYRGDEVHIVADSYALEEAMANGWSKDPPLTGTVKLNLGGELSPAMMAEVQRVDAEARKPSHADLERQIAELQAQNAELKQKRK